jgi:hypothetical protein
MAKRVVLVVCGYNSHSLAIRKCKSLGFQEVDVASMLPRDPGRLGCRKRPGDSSHLVDDVVGQWNFPQTVAAVVAAAELGHVLVKCRQGLHRSPVVGAEAGEVQG